MALTATMWDTSTSIGAMLTRSRLAPRGSWGGFVVF